MLMEKRQFENRREGELLPYQVEDLACFLKPIPIKTIVVRT